MSDQFNPRLSPNEEAVAEKARPAKRLPILCLDFDGVLHGYQSGWQGAAIIPDPPVPGAVQFLHSAVERFQVAIYSSRSGQPGGIDAMRGWLTMWLLAVIEDRREAEHVLSLIQWPTEKPAATVTIDDRAIQFTGEWPSLDEIADFKPWNKRPAPDSTRTGQGEAEEALAEAYLRGASWWQRSGYSVSDPEGQALIRKAASDYADLHAPALAARPAAPEAEDGWLRKAADEIDKIADLWSGDGRAYGKTLAAVFRADADRGALAAHPAKQSELSILRAVVEVFADRTDTRLTFGDRIRPEPAVKAVEQAIASLTAEYEARGGCPALRSALATRPETPGAWKTINELQPQQKAMLGRWAQGALNEDGTPHFYWQQCSGRYFDFQGERNWCLDGCSFERSPFYGEAPTHALVIAPPPLPAPPASSGQEG